VETHFALLTHFIKRSAKNNDTLSDDINLFFIIFSCYCQYNSSFIAYYAGNCSAELSVADTTRQGDIARASRCVCMHTVCTELYATPAFRRFQVSPCEICGGQSDIVTGVPKSTSVFPCQYHFANAASVVSVQRRHLSVC
jgi:hypothetical protein